MMRCNFLKRSNKQTFLTTKCEGTKISFNWITNNLLPGQFYMAHDTLQTTKIILSLISRQHSQLKTRKEWSALNDNTLLSTFMPNTLHLILDYSKYDMQRAQQWSNHSKVMFKMHTSVNTYSIKRLKKSNTKKYNIIHCRYGLKN